MEAKMKARNKIKIKITREQHGARAIATSLEGAV
jgi:hypothetical protein